MTLNGSLVKSSRGCPLLGVPDRFWIYKNLKAVLDYLPIFCSKSTCELRERESIKGRAGNGVSKGELLMYASAACQTLSPSCLCLVPKHKTSSRQYPYGNGLINFAQPKSQVSFPTNQMVAFYRCRLRLYY